MRNNLSLSCFAGLADSCPEELALGYEESLLDEKAKEEGRELKESYLSSSDRGTEKTPCCSVEDFKLPDDVVERILGMIPFPNLLKVRSLSRAWYIKFPRPNLESSGGAARSLFTINDNDHNLISSGSFQRLVSFVSAKWTVYCPVVLGDDRLIGYDPAKKRWQGLFTDSLLALGNRSEPWLISSCGSLICGVSQSPNHQYDVYVTNVLTRNCRKIPPHPNRKVPSLLNLIFDDSGGYNVVLITEEPHEGPYENPIKPNYNSLMHRRVCSQVFDSVGGTWTISDSILPYSTSFAWRSCSVHFGENIYCLAGDDRNPCEHPLQVWVYNLQERKWTEIGHPFGELVNNYSGMNMLSDLTRFKLVICGSKIMVVLSSDPQLPYFDRVQVNSIFIYELDPQTRIMTEKSRGPPVTLFASSEHIMSDGAIIYFCSLDVLTSSPVVLYNVKSEEWSSLVLDLRTAGDLTNKRWADFAVQPGLKPFAAP